MEIIGVEQFRFINGNMTFYLHYRILNCEYYMVLPTELFGVI